MKPRLPILSLLLLLLSACTTPDYGTKLTFNAGELYFTEAVTESEAERLGNFLVEDGFFGGQTISVQLDREGETYLFRMASREGAETDSTLTKQASLYTLQLSRKVFDDAPVDFHFCDTRMETKAVIPFLLTATD